MVGKLTNSLRKTLKLSLRIVYSMSKVLHCLLLLECLSAALATPRRAQTLDFLPSKCLSSVCRCFIALLWIKLPSFVPCGRVLVSTGSDTCHRDFCVMVASVSMSGQICMPCVKTGSLVGFSFHFEEDDFDVCSSCGAFRFM